MENYGGMELENLRQPEFCSFFKSLYWVLKVLKRSIQKTLIRNFLDILETIISMTGFHLHWNTPSMRLVV